MRCMGLTAGLIVVWLGVFVPARAESASDLLEQGIYAEETVGDLEQAKKVYAKIIAQHKTNRPAIAQAYYRLAMCQLKQGDKPGAVKTLQELTRLFPDQKTVVDKAATHLAKLTAPPGLLPLNTVIERFVRDSRMKRNVFIDFDTGTLHAPPPAFSKKEEPEEALASAEAIVAWAKANGSDAFCKVVDLGIDSLFGLDMIAKPWPNHRWDVDLATVRKELAVGMNGPPAIMQVRGSTPVTFLFKTREGGIGVLQILDVLTGKKPNRGIKIRYKLLGELDVTPPAGDVLPLNKITEFVGCRLHRQVTMVIEKPWPKRNVGTPLTLNEADRLDLRFEVRPPVSVGGARTYGVVLRAKGVNYKSVRQGAVRSRGGMSHWTRQRRGTEVVLSRRFIRIGGPFQFPGPGDYQMLLYVATTPWQPSEPEPAPTDEGVIGVATLDVTVKPRIYSQISINDIQPDGTIKFRSIEQRKHTGVLPMRSFGFVNSDFVHVERMEDGKGRELKFTVTHDKARKLFRYHVKLNEPVPKGDVVLTATEGTMTGMVKPYGDTPGAFHYSMQHFPAAGIPTRRIEIYRFPKGIHRLKTTPCDGYRVVGGRTEMLVRKLILPGGSILTRFSYHLPPSAATQAEAPPKMPLIVQIGITRGGITFQGQKISLEELGKRLKALPDPERTKVILEGARNLPYERVLEVQKLCAQAGIKKVALRVTGPPE